MAIQNLQKALQSNTLASLTIEELDNINVQFPYFAVTQILASSKSGKVPNDSIKKASLYKGNPVIFASHYAKEIQKTTINVSIADATANEELSVAEPTSASDYFAQQNIKIENTIDEAFVAEQKVKHTKAPIVNELEKQEPEILADTQNLLVTKSFNDWLLYFKQKKAQEEKEAKSKEALTAMLQHQKLTAAAGEENEVIPEAVFKQAISSISPQENLATEALAEILVNQGKIEQAKEMYAKLSLKYPEKSAYFATKLKKLK
jgi:hypothetical protein